MKELLEKDISTTVINNLNMLKDLKENINMKKWKIRNKNFTGYI